MLKVMAKRTHGVWNGEPPQLAPLMGSSTGDDDGDV
jgi:hypothetical protein